MERYFFLGTRALPEQCRVHLCEQICWAPWWPPSGGKSCLWDLGLSGERRGLRKNEKNRITKEIPMSGIFLFLPSVFQIAIPHKFYVHLCLWGFVGLSVTGWCRWYNLLYHWFVGHKEAHKSGWGFGYNQERSYSWVIQILFHLLTTEQKGFCMQTSRQCSKGASRWIYNLAGTHKNIWASQVTQW